MYLIESFNKQIWVEDIGLLVSPLHPQTITEKQLTSSRCLAELVKSGLLRASPTSLCRVELEAKTPPKKKSLTSAPPEVTSHAPPPSNPKVPESPKGFIPMVEEDRKPETQVEGSGKNTRKKKA